MYQAFMTIENKNVKVKQHRFAFTLPQNDESVLKDIWVRKNSM